MKEYIFKHNIYILKRQNNKTYNLIKLVREQLYDILILEDTKYKKLVDALEKNYLFLNKIHTSNTCFITWLDKWQIHENIFIYILNKIYYYITKK